MDREIMCIAVFLIICAMAISDMSGSDPGVPLPGSQATAVDSNSTKSDILEPLPGRIYNSQEPIQIRLKSDQLWGVSRIYWDGGYIEYELNGNGTELQSDFFNMIDLGKYNVTYVLPGKNLTTSFEVRSEQVSDKTSWDIVQPELEIEVDNMVGINSPVGIRVETNRQMDVKATVTWNDGSAQVILHNLGNNTYYSDFYNTMDTGKYEALISAVDSTGMNLTESISFEVRAPMVVNKSIKITYDGQEQFVDGQLTLDSIALQSGNKYSAIRISDVTESITEIEFHDITYNGQIELGVADIVLPDSVQAYEIDPTGINFSNASVTVTAKGDVLYKCRDWNYSEKTCRGEWIEYMQLNPGEEYTFVLTPDDPAFSEEVNSILCVKDGMGYSCDIDTGDVRFSNVDNMSSHGCLSSNATDECGYLDVGTVDDSYVEFRFGMLQVGDVPTEANITVEYACDNNSYDQLAVHCYNGTDWLQVGSPASVTDDTVVIYQLNTGCYNTSARADDIRIRFGQYAPHSASGKIYLDWFVLTIQGNQSRPIEFGHSGMMLYEPFTYTNGTVADNFSDINRTGVGTYTSTQAYDTHQTPTGESYYHIDTPGSNMYYSEFNDTQAYSWSDYEVRSRLRMNNDQGVSGAGITVYSQIVDGDSDEYYLYIRTLEGESTGVFRLKGDEESSYVCLGDMLSDITPELGLWYYIKARVTTEPTRTRVVAKVWQDGFSEPTDWDINGTCDDLAGSGLEDGSVGLWARNAYTDFDYLVVENMSYTPSINVLNPNATYLNSLNAWFNISVDGRARNCSYRIEGTWVNMSQLNVTHFFGVENYSVGYMRDVYYACEDYYGHRFNASTWVNIKSGRINFITPNSTVPDYAPLLHAQFNSSYVSWYSVDSGTNSTVYGPDNNLTIFMLPLTQSGHYVTVYVNDSGIVEGLRQNFSIDTPVPMSTVLIEDGLPLIGHAEADIKLTGNYIYNYRYSCDNSSFTGWQNWKGNCSGTCDWYLDFNLTEPLYGCNASEGTKYVYAQSRNYYNETGYGFDTIVLNTSAPSLNIIGPLNHSGDTDGDILFQFNVTNTAEVANCSLYINNVINYTDYNVTPYALEIISLEDQLPDSYNWTIQCYNSLGNMVQSAEFVVHVISMSSFTGVSTDISLVDVRSITGFTLEKPSLGKILYTEPVDLSGGADLDNLVTIATDIISINASQEPRLNKSANLTIAGLTYSAKPVVLRDSQICSASICTDLIYSSGNFRYVRQ